MRNYARRWQVIGPQCPPVGTVTSLVGVEHVPVPMRRIGPAEVDYADVFTLTADVVATPEQWARTLFDDVAGVGGQRLWRWLLGLRLAPRSWADTVAGWTIAGSGADWILLQARSWCLTAYLVVRPHEHAVSMGTFVRYDRPSGRSLWTACSAVHCRLVPGLLRDAAKTVGRA